MSERAKQRRCIAAMDFAILEMEIFLDTHPNDMRALKVREQYQAKRRELVDQYERTFGPYVVTTDDVENTTHWTWIDDPWPWDYTGEMK